MTDDSFLLSLRSVVEVLIHLILVGNLSNRRSERVLNLNYFFFFCIKEFVFSMRSPKPKAQSRQTVNIFKMHLYIGTRGFTVCFSRSGMGFEEAVGLDSRSYSAIACVI